MGSNKCICFIVSFCLVLACVVTTTVQGQEARELPSTLDIPESQRQLNSYMFQSSIKSVRSLAELAVQTDFVSEQDVSLGFAPRDPEARFFMIGALYAQALAFLKGGDTAAAAERLHAIEREFISLESPPAMYNYINKVRNMTERSMYSGEVKLEFLGVFEPFLQDLAASQGKDMVVLLYAGSWLVGYGLAAAADDRTVLHQAATLRYFLDEMRRMDAPRGVIESLSSLLEIAEKDRITESDVESILQLVRRIQEVQS